MDRHAHAHSPAVNPSHPLKQTVTKLKGVGEKKAENLARLGIRTIEDLLFYFPYRYEDRRVRDISTVEHEENITVMGTIHSEAHVRFYGPKKSRLTVKVLVDGCLITAVLFNRHYAKKQFKIGQKIRLYGKLNKHRLQITVQDYQLGHQAERNAQDRLLPVYSVHHSLTSGALRKLICQALQEYGKHIFEILPEYLLERYRLLPRSEAVRLLHAPKDWAEGKQARRRMVFEELFLFQLQMQTLKKVRRARVDGHVQRIDHQAVQRFIRSLPFTLTNAQQRVLDEIIGDLEAESAMNRLLLGDVGSGKTLVAAIVLYASVKAGFQGAFMAPTEILAEQHYRSLMSFFRGTNIHLALLTGNTAARERKDILAGLQMGTVDAVVGTHALIQDDVYFKQLGLVITDEQHRFGVRQRQKLRQKGKSPDVLFMTATPIPRTLAITAFGDLDVSIIDQLPQGRKPVKTYWVNSHMFDRVMTFLRQEVSKGRQAYVICPLIEESEKIDFQNVMELHALLTSKFPQFTIGLLHGRLQAKEKEEVMQRFLNNDIQILVTTTVVEVGVDVPNATLMIIQDAERFGLSQLHQLRGRVGRGVHQSYCILLADPKTDVGKERMHIMQSTADGFEVAKQDLKLRGPGEFFGTKQSGIPEFKLADLIHDAKILEVARRDAHDLVQSRSFWEDKEYERLRASLKEQGVFETQKLD